MPLHIFSTGFYSGGYYYLFCDSLNHVNDLALNFLPTLGDTFIFVLLIIGKASIAEYVVRMDMYCW